MHCSMDCKCIEIKLLIKPNVFKHPNCMVRKKYIYRSRLLIGPALSELREPSRRTLCRDSCSLNGLRWARLPRPSYGRYIGTVGICWYGAKPLKPELLGFINESHSCFSVFNTAAVGDVPDELFLWCLRSCSCVCDWAAAKRPCSVDKPLTYNCKMQHDICNVSTSYLLANHFNTPTAKTH